MTRPLQVSTAASTRVSTVLVHRAPTAPAVLLKRGDEKPAVARLQEALQLVGHLKPPFEGRFDARTADAVTAFQQARGLPATGAYDAATRDALREAVAAAAVKTGPALSKGLRGEAVATLERKLKRKGLLEGPADGVFDGRTERAVKAFERQQGWKEDGVVGRRLWRTLGGAGAGSGPSLKAGASGPAVAALQRRLKQLGHYQGPADGSFGAVTERAVRAFQKQQGLTVDGRVDGADWAALGVHLTVREQLGGPLLKQGQRGRAVQLLEARLAERGLLAGKPDGTFDAKTAEAVRRFERRNQLAVDGIADNAVWLALGGAGEGSGPTLKQGARGDGVKVLQRLLAKGGHYDGPVDGDFGPMTAGAVKAFERKHGLTADGVAGQEVWRALGRHVVQNPVTAPADAKEPAHDYRRVSYSGGLMNMRTKIMLQRAEKYAAKMGVRVPFTVVQGSFSHHVSASGGTHDGGGALDLRTWDRSVSDVQKIVKALRMAGFAAWKRGYGGDSFDKHIHAIAIGDRQMSSAARSQVAEYFRGGDGLVGSAPDGDRSVGRPWPKWANRYR